MMSDLSCEASFSANSASWFLLSYKMLENLAYNLQLFQNFSGNYVSF